MNIQERRNKDGKITSYRIRVFDHRDSQTGKQVFSTLSIKYDDSRTEAWNKKNADKQAIIFEKQIEEQTITDSHITFDSYCEYAIKIKEQAGLSPSTVYSYTSYRRRIAPYIGHIQLKQLTPATINKTYSEMLTNGLSKASVYQFHLFIHSMLAMAFKENIIPRNYADAATPPKKEQKAVQALDEDEITEYITEHFAGDCLLAVGDEELIKIHFHTNEPWLVLAYCATKGDIYDVVVENMFRQAQGLQG